MCGNKDREMLPKWETHVQRVITKNDVRKAEQCLIDNGIEEDEAPIVMQALGYILLDQELYK